VRRRRDRARLVRQIVLTIETTTARRLRAFVVAVVPSWFHERVTSPPERMDMKSGN
jgi:hypothetical protein